ncbi:Ribosomal protein S18 acetylase RimI [Natronincola peptidivorans]|uniref:Ribosomal protein S18 acetylase RimI n=1 Tax=Natronincola peptidivorans TaxID=426128 RepID=A0A1I0FUC7_9FIRM|nr:GNAT family N-acetyltransferase [Natronincola peptidivorans]SET61267.1 Ribosomal protein S18 acetylase RimI [Natronincola peptidivorans]
MKIRKATIEDVNDISRIHALSWKFAYRGIIPQAFLDELKEDYWEAAFVAWIKDNVLTTQILVEKGKAIGCVAYGKSRDKSLPDWGEIVSLYLLPEYFGKDYGNKLLHSALADLKESGYESIFLWVLKDNQRARGFYEKNGMGCNNDEYVLEIMGQQLIDVRYVYAFNSINTNPNA